MFYSSLLVPMSRTHDAGVFFLEAVLCQVQGCRFFFSSCLVPGTTAVSTLLLRLFFLVSCFVKPLA